MKKMFLVAALILLSSKSSAMSKSQACSLLKQIRLEMGVVASNIINVNTTRTPEGGPYQFKRFNCEGDVCETESILKVVSIYEPEHPDADGRGYVAYPDIDVLEQEAEMDHLVQDFETSFKICIAH